MSQRQTQPPVPLYILAGGQSRRFGSDKARAELEGQPLIRRIVDRLAPVAGPATVVADVADKYADLGLPTIADRTPGLGPIGGLATALVHLERTGGGPWLLLCSCDLVAPEPAWVRQLLAAADEHAQAVAFQGPRWEPLLALYHQSIQSAAAQAIAEQQLAMWRLLDRVSATPVAPPADLPDLVQVNTRADLGRARRTLDPER